MVIDSLMHWECFYIFDKRERERERERNIGRKEREKERRREKGRGKKICRIFLRNEPEGIRMKVV